MVSAVNGSVGRVLVVIRDHVVIMQVQLPGCAVKERIR